MVVGELPAPDQVAEVDGHGRPVEIERRLPIVHAEPSDHDAPGMLVDDVDVHAAPLRNQAAALALKAATGFWCGRTSMGPHEGFSVPSAGPDAA